MGKLPSKLQPLIERSLSNTIPPKSASNEPLLTKLPSPMGLLTEMPLSKLSSKTLEIGLPPIKLLLKPVLIKLTSSKLPSTLTLVLLQSNELSCIWLSSTLPLLVLALIKPSSKPLLPRLQTSKLLSEPPLSELLLITLPLELPLNEVPPSKRPSNLPMLERCAASTGTGWAFGTSLANAASGIRWAVEEPLIEPQFIMRSSTMPLLGLPSIKLPLKLPLKLKLMSELPQTTLLLMRDRSSLKRAFE